MRAFKTAMLLLATLALWVIPASAQNTYQGTMIIPAPSHLIFGTGSLPSDVHFQRWKGGVHLGSSPVYLGGTASPSCEGGDFFLYVESSTGAWMKCQNGAVSPLASGAFLGLSDTPSTYSGQALKVVRVNVAETALEFVVNTSAPAGSPGDIQVNAAGVLAGLTPGANGQGVCSSGGVFVANCVAGRTYRATSTTSESLLATDRGGWVTFSNASAVAVSIAQAGTAGFESGYFVMACNIGAGVATITPTVSTLNGAASLALSQYDCAEIESNGTNYNALVAKQTVGGSGTPTMVVANEAGTGTLLNGLAKLSAAAPNTVLRTAITDTTSVVGIVTSGAGTTGSATIQMSGVVNCVFENAATSGNIVIIGTTVAGNCRDSGAATFPASGQSIGVALATAAAGSISMYLFPSNWAMQDASGTVRGLVSTAAQTFAGAKTFSSNPIISTASGSLSFSGSGATTINASNTSSSITIRPADTSATVTADITVRGANTSGTGAVNGGTANIGGGSTATTGAGNGGAASLYGGPQTGAATGGTAGSASVLGGNSGGNGSATAGAVIIGPGGGTAATPAAPGALQIYQTFKSAATSTLNAVQCFSADLTVSDCAISATNPLGVLSSATNTQPAKVQLQGLVIVLYDATVSPSAGWYACTSATVAGKVTAQATACAANRQIGIVAAGGTNVTSGTIFVQKN